jgi:hypothetical protein
MSLRDAKPGFIVPFLLLGAVYALFDHFTYGLGYPFEESNFAVDLRSLINCAHSMQISGTLALVTAFILYLLHRGTGLGKATYIGLAAPTLWFFVTVLNNQASYPRQVAVTLDRIEPGRRTIRVEGHDEEWRVYQTAIGVTVSNGEFDVDVAPLLHVGQDATLMVSQGPFWGLVTSLRFSSASPGIGVMVLVPRSHYVP